MYYKKLNQNIITSKKLTGSEFTFKHTNNSGVSLTIEEITNLTNLPSTAKTLSTKDNRLFLAGLTYSPFDLEFKKLFFIMILNQSQDIFE